MHEIAIANSILESVRAEMKRHPKSVARKITVRVGRLAAVDPDALRFSFEVLAQETELESLELEIEVCLPRCRCPDCNFEFDVIEFDSRCPQCGGEKTRYVSGDQLELSSLELEDYEPSTA